MIKPRKIVLWVVLSIILVGLVFGITWLGVNWKKLQSKSNLYTHEEYMEYGDDRYQAGLQQGESYRVLLTDCQRKLSQVESEKSKLVIQVNTLKAKGDADAELISQYEAQIANFEQQRTELNNQIVRLQALLQAYEEIEMTMSKVEFYDGDIIVGCYYSKEGETLKLTEYVPKKKYHSFDGWVTADGTVVTSQTIVESNLTLTPSFSWQAGIYDAQTDGLVMSWEDMISNDIIQIQDNEVLRGDGYYNEYIDQNKELTICVSSDVKTIKGFSFNWNFSKYGNKAKVKKVIMTDSVEILSDSAFSGMEFLEEIELSKNIKTIGIYAFANCSKLVSIDLPEGLTSLGRFALTKCSMLKRLVLPSSLKTVGELGVGLKELEVLIFKEGIETIKGLVLGTDNEAEKLRYIYVASTITSITGQIYRPHDVIQKIDFYFGWTTMPDWVNQYTFTAYDANYETHLGVTYEEFLQIVND